MLLYPAKTGAKFLGLLPLLLVVLIGGIVRTIDINQESLWLDEAFSLQLSHASIEDVLRESSKDNHPPLHFLLLHFWTEVFGDSAISVRFLSLLFGVGTIPLTYFIGKRLFSEKVGLTSALLVALSPLLIWYSQEARGYSLLIFLALLSFWSFIEAMNSRRVFWILFVISTTLMFYTHYFGFFFAALQVITFFLLWKNNWQRFRDAIMSGITIILLYSPWIWVMWGKEGKHSALVWATTSEHTFVNTLVHFLGGYPTLEMIAPRSVSFLEIVAIIAASLAFLSALIVSIREKKIVNLSIVLLFALLPGLIAYVLTNTYTPMYHIRFFLYSIPFFFIAVAYGITNIHRLLPNHAVMKKAIVPTAVISFILLGMFVLLMAVSWGTMHGSYDKEDWKHAVPELYTRLNPGDIVVSDPPYNHLPLTHYAGKKGFHEHSFTSSVDGGNVSFFGYHHFYGQDINLRMQELSEQSDRIWLVQAEKESDFVGVKDWLDTHYIKTETYTFPKLIIVLYVRPKETNS